jgi:hypothetical protein
MSPQIGQRVQYRLAAADVDYIRGHAMNAGGQGHAKEGQVLPAIITATPDVAKLVPVLDDQNNPTGQMKPGGDLRPSVNVRIQLDSAYDLWRPDVVSGTSNGQWYPDVDADVAAVREELAGLREELAVLGEEVAALRAQTAPAASEPMNVQAPPPMATGQQTVYQA